MLPFLSTVFKVLVGEPHGRFYDYQPLRSTATLIHHAADAPKCSFGFALADTVSMATYLLVSLSTAAVIVGAGDRYDAIASMMLGVGANSNSSLS